MFLRNTQSMTVQRNETIDHVNFENNRLWNFTHSASDGKESACNAGDLGFISGSGRSPGVGIGNPLQYSCLKKSMDRGDWWTTVQVSSVAQSCLTLCDPMNCSMPDLTVHHQLLELTQIHVHWVGDAIQPSHPLLSPSPATFNLS